MVAIVPEAYKAPGDFVFFGFFEIREGPSDLGGGSLGRLRWRAFWKE
jgi:hypothetical protein